MSAAGMNATTTLPEQPQSFPVLSHDAPHHALDPPEEDQEHGDDGPRLDADRVGVGGAFLLRRGPQAEEALHHVEVASGADGKVFSQPFHDPEDQRLGDAHGGARRGGRRRRARAERRSPLRRKPCGHEPHSTTAQAVLLMVQAPSFLATFSKPANERSMTAVSTQ